MTRAEHLRDEIVRSVGASGFGAHGLHVLVGDDDEAGHLWRPDERRDVHSVAKGVCVLAAGLAAEEGLLSLDEPVAPLVAGARPGPGVDEITMRHLLSMSSGVDLPWSETIMTDWPDLALEFLSRPSRGRVFQYSTASTYTAMRALATRVGDVAEYLRPRLFDPLGVDDPTWERCPLGHVVGAGGLWLTTAELSRLGRLVRDRGRWGDRQLVPAGIVDAMHSDWVVSGRNEGYRGYALAGWDGPGDAWRLHGAYGQLLVFGGDAVVTVTADDHLRADALTRTVADLLASPEQPPRSD